MDEPARGRLGWLLEPRRALQAALLLALLLTLPSIAIGFYADDWAQIAYLEGRIPGRPWWDLYWFAPGDPAGMLELKRSGLAPWWSSPSMKMHFLRPLTSGLLALDHALFARSPLGYHLHQIAWYAALVAAVGALYRRVLPGATGAVALLLFAVDDAHAQPAGWIACRHMVIGGVPAVLAIVAHVRHREEDWRPGRWASPLALAVGLLGSEAAMAGFLYIAAYEALGRLLGADGEAPPWRDRLRGVAPALAIVALYSIVYKVLRCGSAGNGAYLDPASDPAAFAIALLHRVPILLGDSLFGVASDLASVLPRALLVGIGLAAVAVTALLLRAVLPSVSPIERARLRWLVPAALAALAMSAGGFPGSRLLLLPSIGGAALVAVLLRHGFARAASGGAGLALRRAGCALLVLVHVVASPLLLATYPAVTSGVAHRIESIARDAEISGPPQRVFLISSDPMAGFYVAAVRLVKAPESMASVAFLSMAKLTHRITRTGPDKLEIAMSGGRLLDGPFEQVFRSNQEPFRVGEEVMSTSAVVRVTAVDRGMPTRFELDSTIPLDDPSFCLLVWREGRLRKVSLSVGESIEVPWSPGPTGFF